MNLRIWTGRGMNWTPFVLILPCLLVSAGAGYAQAAAPGDWNAPRALELIDRARARRAVPKADSGLSNYRATAGGYVYFYLDRGGSDEKTLVKVDQIALEVYWGHPDRTKQRIVGLRDVSKLPNRMRYHLDHLTVVQDEFGDVIRMGDGDEVREVPHPVAAGAASFYDFRLADSLTIRLAGAQEPIRVYEIEVRPRRFDQPALIGSVYLDRATAAIVRMSFTFTPASYVDRRLDYIRVSLDNGLWNGRYWLPNQQELEIRRQVPELDLPAGAVIRGVLRIGDYRFNLDLPPTFFYGPKVVAMPRRMRERYAFRAGIFDDLEAEGLGESTDLATLRRQVVQLAGRRFLSGLPRLRLHLPNASSVFRYDRAEGVFLGAGATYGVGQAARIAADAGYAVGAGRLSFGGALRLDPGEATTVRLHFDRAAMRDLGIRPGTAGLLNSATAALTGEDLLDPYRVTGIGIEAGHQLADGEWRAGAKLGYERHESMNLEETAAAFDGDADFRPVRPVTRGSLFAGRLALRRTEPPPGADGWTGEFAVETGSFAGDAYLRPTLELIATHGSTGRGASIGLRGAAGLALGDPPPQKLFLFGGQNTLPGYPYRGFVGDRFALAEVEAAHDLVAPWVRARAVGAAGWSALGSAPPPAGWDAAPSDGIRTSLGAGLGLFYDVLRVDLVRGLNRGEWQLILSVRPDLWHFL